MSSLSIIIPTLDTAELTLRCVETLADVEDAQVIVVDDCSSDDTVSRLRARFPDVTVLENETTLGFSRSINRGLEVAAGDSILLLNSDTEHFPGSIQKGLARLEADSRVGVVGARLVFPDGSPQWSGGKFPSLVWLFLLSSGLARWLRRWLPLYRRVKDRPLTAPVEVDWVPGAALLTRRQVILPAGLASEFVLYAQDIDLCQRARRQGFKVLIDPDFVILHHLGSTTESLGEAASRVDPRETLLWRDILRWASRHRPARWVALARLALVWGLRLRSFVTLDSSSRRLLREQRTMLARVPIR